MITPGPSPSIGPKIQDGAHLTVGLSVHLGSLTNAKAIFLHFRDSKKILWLLYLLPLMNVRVGDWPQLIPALLVGLYLDYRSICGYFIVGTYKIF